MSVKAKITLAAFLATVLSAAGAEAVEFNHLQPEKSAVTFVSRQMNVPIEGHFKRFQGRVSFDPAKPALAQAEISIELASVDAGSDDADDALATSLWFDTRRFPIARFVATSIKPLGGNRYDVAGKMTVKGRTRDVSTRATFRQEGGSGVFEGAFVLKRADYAIGEGMWADFGTVANEVQVRFRLVAAAAGR